MISFQCCVYKHLIATANPRVGVKKKKNPNPGVEREPKLEFQPGSANGTYILYAT